MVELVKGSAAVICRFSDSVLRMMTGVGHALVPFYCNLYGVILYVFLRRMRTAANVLAHVKGVSLYLTEYRVIRLAKI